MRRTLPLELALVLTALAACRPSPPNGALTCNKSGGRECPVGYACEPTTNTCWKEDELPDLGASFDLSTPPDLEGADLLEPADMTRALQKGEGCSTAPGSIDCAFGLTCVDGVCCDSPCDGQCQACNLENLVGTCSTVTSGQPRGGRPACAGAGTSCQGSCTGASATACTYPGNGTMCGASCDGTCNGAGGCSSAGGGSCPNGFACQTGGCRTSCSENSHCQPNFVCNAPSCERMPESDCLDGVDNNGDGLADCQDPTCAAVTMCVPAVAVGNEIGIFPTGSCPATGFTVTSTQHQNLQTQPCGGCGCKIDTTCQLSLKGYSGDTCGGSNTVNFNLEGNSTGVGTCAAPSPAVKPASLKYSSISHKSSTCVATTGPSTPTPTWGTTKTYCGAARQSSTCPINQVCVPKPPQATPVCVRVPSAGAGCPAGYPNTQGTWYAAFDPAQCECGSCMKTKDGSCPSTIGVRIDMFGQTGCPPESLNGLIVDSHSAGACVPNAPAQGCMIVCTGWSTIHSARFSGALSITPGTCSRSASTTKAATPTGPSTICCQ